MKNLYQKIKNIISPRKKSKSIQDINEKLLQIERGKSFKGHEATLTIDNLNEDETPKLYLSNKYLAGYVSYSFCNKNQNTIRRVIHTYYLPKWLTQKRLDILTQLQYVKNGRSSYHEPILFNVTDKIKINLHDYEVIVEETVVELGLKMYGHRHNIYYLNELKRLGSYFRKWMKGIDISTMEFNKTRKDIYQKDGIVFSGNLFKTCA